ncbi:hypothetical protein, partial [Psychroflexus sediminis]
MNILNLFSPHFSFKNFIDKKIFNKIFFLLSLFFVNETAAQLNGTYTIGTGQNYNTFNEAIDELNTIGISGPVTFKVSSGIYDEKLSFLNFPGNSCETPVVFESASGVNTDVVLQHTFTAYNDFVIEINGADGISFKNMTLTHTANVYYGRIFNILGGSDCLVLSNNVIKGTNLNDALIYSRGLNNSHTYDSNSFDTGSYGIDKNGTNTSSR